MNYARYFNTVEIDQWFWSLFPQGVKLPDPKAVCRYPESVPDDFRFGIKAPNAITLTHFYAKQPKGSEAYANKPNPDFLNQDLLSRFLESLESIRAKLGPIMFQFEYLNRKKMPSLEAFLDKLNVFFTKAPKGYPYAIEIRNNNYLKQPFFAFLKDHQVGCVLLDGYYMPPIGEVARDFQIHTGNFTVLRLHGPDRKGIEEKTKGIWNEVIEPQDERLNAATGVTRRILKDKNDTYIYVNNHYEGCAPLTIERFLKLV